MHPALRRVGVALGAAGLIGAGGVGLGATRAAAAEAQQLIVGPGLVYAQVGRSLSITVKLGPAGSTSVNGVDVTVISGPDQSSPPLAGVPCPAQDPTQVSPYAGPFSCPFDPAGGPGVDTLRIFDDAAGATTINAQGATVPADAAGDPSVQVQVEVAGPAADLAFTPTGLSALTPITASASTGVCHRYTLSLQDANGDPLPATGVSVTVTGPVGPTPTSGPAPTGPIFCDPTVTGAAAKQDPTLAGTPAGSGSVARTETLTTGDGTAASPPPGQLSVGVASDTAGSVTLTATAAGLTATAGLTVAPGGAPADVTEVAVNPPTQNIYAGSATTTGGTAELAVSLLDAAGDPVVGVTPTATITGGPDAAATVSCNNPSDQTGIAVCSYTATTATAPSNANIGTDQVTVTVPATAGGPAAPTGTASVDAVTAPPPTASSTLTVSCAGTSGTTSCPMTLPSAGENLTATLSGPSPLSGYLIQFSVSAATGQPKSGLPFTLHPGSCLTGTNGSCTVTVEDPQPVAGDTVTVTAVANGAFGANPNSTAPTGSAAVSFTAPSSPAGAVTLTPAAATEPVGATSATVTAAVTDPTGAPVSGADVRWVAAGRNDVTNASPLPAGASDSCAVVTGSTSQAGTDGAGRCQFAYPDTGSAPAGGVDTITAVYPAGGVAAQARAYWVPRPAGVTGIGLDLSSCDGHFTRAGSNPSPTGFDTTVSAATSPDPTAGTPVVPVTRICVAVTDPAGSPLFGTPITLRTTSATPGVGEFTDPAGTPLTDPATGAALTSLTMTVADRADPTGAAKPGYAVAFVRSANPGAQTITAAAGGQTASGQISWASSPPTVTGLTPAAGSAAGGTEVTITGSHLGGATAVDFAATPAQGYQINPDGTQITAVSPPATAGDVVDVTVTTPAGTTPTGPPDRFSYTDAPQPQFTPITPTRVYDSRPNPLPPGSTTRIDITRAGALPAPRGATAVALNVTAVLPAGAGVGYLEVYPDDPTFTTGAASTLNFQPGAATANFTVVALTTGSPYVRVTLPAGATPADVVIDVFGYFNATALHAQPPQRVTDTRPGAPTGANTADPTGPTGPLATSTPHPYTLTGHGGLPATGVNAVALNITAINPAGGGNLQAYPAGTTPTGSTLNLIPHTTKAEFVILPLPADGTIDITDNGTPTNITIDVDGYLDTTTLLHTQTPTRLLDTRPGSTQPDGLPTGPLTPNTPTPIPVTTAPTGNVPTAATAVLVNLAAVAPSQPPTQHIGNLRLGPDGGGTPQTSNIDYIGADTISGFAILTLPPAGKLDLYTDTTPTNIVLDILGWYPTP